MMISNIVSLQNPYVPMVPFTTSWQFNKSINRQSALHLSEAKNLRKYHQKSTKSPKDLRRYVIF